MTGQAKNNEKEPLEAAIDELQEAAQSAKVSPRTARARARRLQLFFTLALTASMLLAIAVRLDSDHYFDLDVTISRAIQSMPIPGFGTLMRIISVPGDDSLGAVLLVAASFFALFLLRYRIEAYALAFSAGLGELLNLFLKWIVGRPRPVSALVQIMVEETSLSFPSGHVMHYVVFYGFLFFFAYSLLKRSLLRTALLVLFGGLLILVGFSRVYLGAHWPSDVAAAYMIGGAWLMFAITLYRRWSEGGKAGERRTANGERGRKTD